MIDENDCQALINVEQPVSGGEHSRRDVLAVSGWAVAPGPTQAAYVRIGEGVFQRAHIGIARPDVAVVLPDRPHSHSSGFSTRAVLQETGDQEILVSILDERGVYSRSVRLQLGCSAALPEIASRVAIHPRPPVHTYLDSAYVDRSSLEIKGSIAAAGRIMRTSVKLGSDDFRAIQCDLPASSIARKFAATQGLAATGFAGSIELRNRQEPIETFKLRVATAQGEFEYECAVLEGQGQSASPAGGGLEFNVETANATADGVLRLSGWAFGDEALRRIGLYFGELHLGDAVLGLERPDVALKHPSRRLARNSGFVFQRRIAAENFAGRAIQLRFESQSTLREEAAVEVKASGALASSDAHAGTILNLDSPRVHGGEAEHPLTDRLTLWGWAISNGSIASIDVFIDDRYVGAAHHGIRREDVLERFPERSGALLSGFAFTRRLTDFRPGPHAVEVRMSDDRGGEEATRFTVVLTESVESDHARLDRLHLPQVAFESRLLIENVTFVVLIRMRRATRPFLRLARETMISLALGAWSELEVVAITGDRGLTDDELDFVSGDTALRVTNIAPAAEDPVSLRKLVANPERRCFVIPLVAGDRIAAAGLQTLALEVQTEPQAEVFYSDERRRSAGGSDEVSDKLLKPAWSPELLLSTNYIGRLWCIDLSRLLQLGLCIPDLFASGDYDVLLRCSIAGAAFHHIPKVLCRTREAHWDSKDQEFAALKRLFSSASPKARVKPGILPRTYYRRYAVQGRPLVSVIIPTAGVGDHIHRAITSLRALTRNVRYEVLCIDNIPERLATQKDWLRRNADATVELQEPFNWSRFNNKAVQHSAGEFLLFLNDDVEVTDPDWMKVLVEQAQRPEVGVVGPRLLYPDRTVQHAGIYLTTTGARHAFRFAHEADPGHLGLALTQRDVIAVTGACMIMRREVFERCGGFDERHSVVNNDVDFCFRVRDAGLRVVYTPSTTLIHKELASRAELPDFFDAPIFWNRWRTLFAKGDPFFSPGLDEDDEQFAPDAEPVCPVYVPRPILDRTKVSEVLVLKVDHIGDYVTVSPAFAALKNIFPSARITAVLPRASTQLRYLQPAIDDVIEFNFFHANSGKGQLTSKGELGRLRSTLKDKHFDLAIDFRKSPDTRHLLRLVNAQAYAGYNHEGQFPWLDVSLEWEGDSRLERKNRNVGDDILLLTDAISRAVAEIGSTISNAPLQVARARALESIPELSRIGELNQWVALHPGSGAVMRQWPAEYFGSLAELLIEREGVGIIILGDQSEAEILPKMNLDLETSKRSVSMIGCVGLVQLPNLLSACDLYVGNNSGPQHLAAALGVPTIGVHSGVVDAAEWGPVGLHGVALQKRMHCSPCYLVEPNSCPRGLACLNKLRPRDVYPLCRKMLMFRKVHADPS